ncbi:hypothetical protein [uncultured Aeromicrobium sp.]|mgnify:CR=1 FL=1|uniref:hypothetical protein n=1 Tax=uncultured Aeromicrobium sp. TaxID=337820 RepID=UPI0025FC379B|nr:hypothetical protein [uncultured Aeromicrobium sp.]
MAAPKNENHTPEKPDAEEAEAQAAQEASSVDAPAQPKPKGQRATHRNPYGDEVHVREDLHSFVESRGYTRL